MKKVFVVDDEFDILSTLEDILVDEGFEVTTCANGQLAIERLKNEKPDLILLDVMLPVRSGLDVLKEVRKSDAKTPVILMSAVEPRVKQSDYGWNVFLRKPFTLDRLVASVQKAMKA